MSSLNNKILEIQDLLAKGKINTAEKKIKTLLIQFPNNLNLLQLQSAIYIRNNDDDKALATLNKMSEIKDHESIFNNIAMLEKKKSNYDSAIKFYSKAIKLNNKVPEIFFNLGNCFSSLNETNESILNFKKAIDLKDDYTHAYNNLGREYMCAGNYDLAHPVLKKALVIDPNFNEAILNQSLLFILENKVEEAIRILNKAIQSGNKNNMIIFYYAITNSFIGNDTILEELLNKLDNNNLLSIWLSSWKFLFSKKSQSFSLAGNRKEIISLALKESNQDGLYLEFGVGNGTSINYISSIIKDNIHGFDSFEGLPEAWNHLPEKAFSSNGIPPKLNSRIILHKGYFEETLPHFCNEYNEKVSFLHFDCDLYKSTKTIFSNLENMIVSGTIFLFDEMISYEGFENHEFKAFKEFIQKTEKNYECLIMNYLTGQVVIRIL
tara:strand:+ start:449 stop:1756 length:1308 start_codon:yes stop_codon:yes gene_type:complete